MTPKYRFSEFSDEICPKSLSSYLIVNPDRNKDLTYSKDDVLSVSGELGVVNQIELLGRSYAGESVAEYHIVGNNDIVYTKSPLKANPYGIVKCNKGKTGIVSTLYAVYHCKGNTNPHFVDYYFAYDNRLNRYLKPLVRIGAKHDMKIGNEEVLVGTVGFPSLYEQQKIADFLTAYDEKVSLQQQKVEALEKRKKGLLQKVFSQEIRFKADDGSEFPEWEEKLLSEEAIFLSGLTYKPENVKENGTLVLRSSNIQDNQIVYNDTIFVQMEIPSHIRTEKGDILMCVRNGSKSLVGKCALINESDEGKAWGAFMTVIRSKSKNAFVYYFVSSNLFTQQMFKDLGTATIAQITFGMLKECQITIPCLKEQQKIADFFSGIDEQIELEKQRLEAMQTIKKGLLQQLFCDGSEEEEGEPAGAAAIYQLRPQASTLQAAQPDVEYNRSGQ